MPPKSKAEEAADAAAAAADVYSQVAVIGRKGRNILEQTKVFRQAINIMTRAFGVFSRTLTVLLVLFILHQLFFWIDQDPEGAFDRAAFAFEVAELTWDTTFTLYGGAIDIFNAGIVPIWNSLAFYFAEPLIVLLLEIFSLVFAKQHWTGVIPEADFPYAGFDCVKNIKTAQWCGASAECARVRNGPTC